MLMRRVPFLDLVVYGTVVTLSLVVCISAGKFILRAQGSLVPDVIGQILALPRTMLADSEDRNQDNSISPYHRIAVEMFIKPK